MAELPLFPLNVVLFPGMMLPLHIFEERYRALINQCAKDQSPFGVVLIKSGWEVGETAIPHTVGTTAYIIELDRFEDGRLNIIVVGRQRFRLQRLLQYEPHLVADVEFYPLRSGDPQEMREKARHVYRLLTGYIGLLTKAMGIELRLEELPTNPPTLAILAAIALQVSLNEKQELLEIPSYERLLEREETLLRRERALLAYVLRSAQKEPDDSLYAPHFSPN